MTDSIDYRKQVLSSIDNGLTVREATAFYTLSTSTIHSWRQSLKPNKEQDKASTKIPDDTLLQDVKAYPDDCQYERANCLDGSKTGIHLALKQLNISQKKALEYPTACLIKRAKYLNHLNDYIIQS